MALREAHYVIPGDPVPWKRPAGKHHRYDEQKQIKLLFGLHLKEQHTGKPFEGPLHLHIVFHMPLSKKLTMQNALKWDGKFHHSRPDFSNLLKLLEDCGNGLIFKDDSQIAKLSGDKVYSAHPRTEFTIRELEW